ncbi:MAG TPA: type I methionyl aminopeptidase [Verrucomicrobiae bacterium]|nr:type I methionyl aminopeptidase [Verrucomicrobiae bacterium]
MSIASYEELLALKEAGRIVRLALEAMRKEVRAGVTTGELARVGGKVMRENGARSAPRLVYGFPGDVLISLNDEAVHGIPSDSRTIRAGDLVKLDVTFEKGGYMADAAMTVAVQPAAPEACKLARCAESAFRNAMQFARANHRVNEIGRAVEREVKRNGFQVIRELGGHGIGRTIHEEPSVPNYDDPHARGRLKAGMVLTVEPILAAGHGEPRDSGDGWTVKTADGSLSAHYEHTIVITEGAPLLLTA